MNRKALFYTKCVVVAGNCQVKLHEGSDLGAGSWKISHVLTM